MSTPGDLLNALGREARRLAGGHAGAAGTPRVFRGRTVAELIPKIERDLGPDAIVVRRREGLTGGVMGFFQHPWVEIEAVPGTAGIDLYDELESVAPPFDDPPPAAAGFVADPLPAPAEPAFADPQGPAAPLSAQPSPDAWPEVAAPAPEAPGQYLFGHLATLARAGRADAPAATRSYAAPPVQAPPVASPPPHPAAPPHVAAPPPHAPPPPHLAAPPPPAAPVPPPAPSPEPVDFHELIPLETRRPAALPPPPGGPAQSRERRTVQPGSHARARAGVERGLARYGVGERLADELIEVALAHALPFAPRSGLAAAVRATLAQRIPAAPPLPATGASIVLVGAGGSGKTTCCAALIDAYRTGSTLPAAFATILGAEDRGELQLLMSPQLLKPAPLDSPRALRALRGARSDGLAVLDTPRLSPSDKKGIRRLGRLLAELAPDRILLALPATLGSAAAAQLLEALAPLHADALVVTHADETDQIGVAVEAACRFELAPEYVLSHGRSGGWRLRRLDPQGLAGMVLP